VNDFGPDVRRALTAAGCYFLRHGKGDHDIWYSPITRRALTVDGKIKARHTANAVPHGKRGEEAGRTPEDVLIDGLGPNVSRAPRMPTLVLTPDLDRLGCAASRGTRETSGGSGTPSAAAYAGRDDQRGMSGPDPSIGKFRACVGACA
jgi:hypothetical protein